MPKPLWKPTAKQIRDANLTAYMSYVKDRFCGATCSQDYEALYNWSIENPRDFWLSIWQYCDVIGDLDPETVLVPNSVFRKTKFFQGSKLNYAENLLRCRSNDEALVFWGEDIIKRRMTYRQLARDVAQVAASLKEMGIKKGDRVAAYLPNMPETMVVMLATVSIGAIFSSCSPDFGVKGVLDRFCQIEPKVLFTTSRYYFRGKEVDISAKVKSIKMQLPTLEKVIVCSYGDDECRLSGFATNLLDFKDSTKTEEDLTFERVPFNHPLFIMFSSGTTGIPKCIVHGHGGTLLQHLKEQQLHSDIKPKDRVFYYTTCGWMMWNWLASVLASQATLLLYDGSPFAPTPNILFDMLEQEKATFFGVSAKYIDALNNEGLKPVDTHDLSRVRSVSSTGSVLSPESFDYIYESVTPKANLASISGGTDILSCFALGNPISPVWRGELQTRGLGMAVETFNDKGESVTGEKGELVCTKPFPSMPIQFWNDPGDKRYHSAYFDRYKNIWCHGDYVEITDHNGMIFSGRSDSMLNPGGVRIGTAEIYRQVERIPDVLESIAVGQQWDDDVRVVLFVKLRDGLNLTDELEKEIRTEIRTNASPRHVPKIILTTPDIPRTISGKIVELAVTDIIHDRTVKNIESLANPEALEYFKNRPELAKGA